MDIHGNLPGSMVVDGSYIDIHDLVIVLRFDYGRLREKKDPSIFVVKSL